MIPLPQFFNHLLNLIELVDTVLRVGHISPLLNQFREFNTKFTHLVPAAMDAMCVDVVQLQNVLQTDEFVNTLIASLELSIERSLIGIIINNVNVAYTTYITTDLPKRFIDSHDSYRGIMISK
jgi:hypothetical protein